MVVVERGNLFKDKKRKKQRKSKMSPFYDQMDKQQCQEGTYVSYNNV